MKQAKVCKGRFTGDPSYEFEHTEIKKTGEGEDATEEEETVRILVTFSAETNTSFSI